MQYALITYDGKNIIFEEVCLALVEKNMLNKTAFSLKGQIIQGADIRRVEKIGQEGTNLASEMVQETRDMFMLPGGVQSVGFWEKVFNKNIEARKNGVKTWIYANAINYAKTISGFTLSDDLFDFCQAEYESVKEKNYPEKKKDYDLLKKTKSFYDSEIGKDCLKSI